VELVVTARVLRFCSYCVVSAPASNALAVVAQDLAMVQSLTHRLLQANALMQLLTHCDKERRLPVSWAARSDISPSQVRVQASIVRHL